MKTTFSLLVLSLLSSQALAQTKTKPGKEAGAFAEATLAPKSGSKVTGTVTFSRAQNGVHVVASISGGTAGPKGIHIHEKGDCSAADASSAGGHFNPTGAAHAGPEAQTRHAGDLGNIVVKDDGKGTLNLDVPTLSGFSDWNSIIGKAVVVHAKADDEKSQPAGAAGDRIACGVIQAVKAN